MSFQLPHLLGTLVAAMRLPLVFLLTIAFALVASSAPAPAHPTSSEVSRPSSSFSPSTDNMKRALLGSEDLVKRSGGGMRRVKAEKRRRSEGKQGEAKRMKRAVKKEKKKRCFYVGTFFHLIDCNAPANSTSIPYAVPSSSSAAPAPPSGTPSGHTDSKLATVSRKPTAVAKESRRKEGKLRG